MERIADFFIRYLRWFVVGLGVCSLAALVYVGVEGVRFDYNIESFLPEADPVIAQYRAFEEKYAPDDNVVLIGFTHPNVFAYPVLRDLEAITEALEQIPDVDRVMSLVRAEGLRVTENGLESERLISTLTEDPAQLAAQRRGVLSDSLAVGYVVNRTGDVTAMFVQIDPEANNYAQRRTVITGIQQVLAPYAGQYTFRYSGIPFLRNTYVDAIQVETIKYALLCSLVIMVVLVWMFRRVQAVVLPLLVVYIGLLWTVAVIMLMDSAIDVLTSTVSAIILVVGVADAIHLLNKYYDGIQAGLGQQAAIRAMVVRLGAATLFTSVTTAVGFASLATSVVVPMQRFGIFTAAGVMLTFLISMILLTALLTWMPPPKNKARARLRYIEQAMVWIDRFAAAHPWRIVGAAAVLVGLSLVGISQLRVNSRVNDDLGKQTQMYRDMVFFQERLAAPFPLEVLLTAQEPDAFKSPDRLRQVAQVQAYLAQQPGVRRTVSVVDVLRRVNQAMHQDSVAYYRLPEAPDLTSQYLFLLELTGEEPLAQLVNFDYSEVRISALVDDVGSYYMNPFLARLDSMMAVTLDPDLTPSRTGTIILAASVGDNMTRALLQSIGLAFLFISILMGFIFKSVRLVVISLIPNLVPLVLTAGVMGLMGIDIKPATAVIFSIAFGIAVDDTIHSLARLRQELGLGRPMREAIRSMILGTGKAVTLTSIILFAGFMVFVTSSFESSVYMGALTAATIAFALFADLLLLPALLHLSNLVPGTTGPATTDNQHQRTTTAIV